MALLLPFDSVDREYSVSCLIEDQRYIFDLNWNERDESWYMSMSDDDGNPILSGAKIVLYSNLIGFVSDMATIPEGAIVAIDTADSDEEAGRYDLGDRVLVLYIPVSEIA